MVCEIFSIMITGKRILTYMGGFFLIVGLIVIFYGGIQQPMNSYVGIIDQIMLRLTSSSFTSGLTIFGLGVTYLAFADTQK